MTIPKILSAEFVVSAHQIEQLPGGVLPEVAFWGRSNVGKSSLINVLLHRQNLVRTSSRPGCTQAINYFLVNRVWHFVDLPGYGYAQAPLPVKEKWLRLISTYLETQKRLRAVVWLLDARRQPGPEELDWLDRLRSWRQEVVVVLTKADKIKRGQRDRRQSEIAAQLAPSGVKAQDFIWFSTLTQEGRRELWGQIIRFLS
ncbi:ribosome biogenesis GTP-binding protein YihA/YsxC [Desulfobacca acetoxidans]|nr:YihA family ribosome biogenesis GTP-binding protein [Desulfobacterales bacterium]